VLVRLPFFLIPLLVHAPAYAVSRYGAGLAVDEEESQAQNKIAFGLILTATSYGVLFWILWAVFWLTPIGAALAAGGVWLMYNYYVRVIDDVYRQ
jgi:glycerol-3-phosphate O-acyltransferase / dihydroxyacetone phosphate acyltransferase